MALHGRLLVVLIGLFGLIGAAQAATGPIGFGQATKGGCTEQRCICHVRTPTQSALLACLDAPGSGTIVFDSPATITIDSPPGGARATVKIPSNKTLAGPVTLMSQGTTLEIDNQSNIVIHDIAFRSSLSDHPGCKSIRTPKDSVGCGIGLYVLGDSKNIWIDHNDFSQCGEKCIVVWAPPPRGGLPTGHVAAPDLITISNNRFTDSYFGVLVGAAAQIAQSQLPAHERATFYGNFFDQVVRRTPRAASHAWIHVFNNYVRRWGGSDSCRGGDWGFGPSATGGAQLDLEDNILEAWPAASACKQAVDTSRYVSQVGNHEDRGAGLVRAADNETLNGAAVAENDPAAVFDPHAFYKYTLLPASAVAAVRTSAGVRGGK